MPDNEKSLDEIVRETIDLLHTVRDPGIDDIRRLMGNLPIDNIVGELIRRVIGLEKGGHGG